MTPKLTFKHATPMYPTIKAAFCGIYIFVIGRCEHCVGWHASYICRTRYIYEQLGERFDSEEAAIAACEATLQVIAEAEK